MRPMKAFSFSLLQIAAILLITNTAAMAKEASEKVKQNVELLLQSGSCAGCDLQGADFTRRNLAGVDLSGANLQGASFMLADLSGWNEMEKVTYFPINLKGPALTVLSNLPARSRSDYATLTAALDSRFGGAHQAELNRARLRNRRRRRDEGLPELAEDIERLARLAYPNADLSMLEVLGKDQFIDALPQEDMRLRIRQMRPSSLREALEHALELESYELASQQPSRPVRETHLRMSEPQQHRGISLSEGKGGEELLQSMQECIKLLQQCAAGYANPDGKEKREQHAKPAFKKPREDITCWRCHQRGHVQRNCKKKALDGREASSPTQQNQGNGQ